LPIQGGEYEVSTLFAESFAKKGYQVLRFERRAEWLEADREVAALGPLAAQYRRDILRGIERWLGAGPSSPERLGLFFLCVFAPLRLCVEFLLPQMRRTSVVRD
jgi:hypothetical protein